jgi:hypothetical protein
VATFVRRWWSKALISAVGLGGLAIVVSLAVQKYEERQEQLAAQQRFSENCKNLPSRRVACLRRYDGLGSMQDRLCNMDDEVQACKVAGY